MPALSVDLLFEAAARILTGSEKTISFVFQEDAVRIRFPTTRRLAEFLGVPHYYVLPFIAVMEQEELVTRAERVGVLTTMKGTIRLMALLTGPYNDLTAAIVGKEIITVIQDRITEVQANQLPHASDPV